MPGPTPESFIKDEVAPDRVGGLEIEFDTQFPGETIEKPGDYELFDAQRVAASGIGARNFANSSTYWLRNGGNLHPDVGRVEFSGYEGDDARNRAAAGVVGMRVIQRLTPTFPDARAFLHSGTLVGKKSRTLGAHRNYMAPQAIADSRLPGLVDAYQATRIWAWGGVPGPSGMELCQKAPGLGEKGTPTSYQSGSRTGEGYKPMGWIKIGDSDVFARPHPDRLPPWIRVEERIVDPLFSRWALYMSEAVGSLLLRFAEHPEVFPANDQPLDHLRFVNPVRALLVTSRDLEFKSTHETVQGKNLTAINTQELIAQYGDRLRERILLPDAEYGAVDKLFDMCDRLRQVDLLNGYVQPIASYVDFGPRIAYLLKKFGDIRNIKSTDADVLNCNLYWNKISPEGPGIRVWNTAYAKGKAPDPIGEDLIEFHMSNPPQGTRAAFRSAATHDPAYTRKVINVTWPYVMLKGGGYIMMDSYESDPSPLKKESYRQAR